MPTSSVFKHTTHGTHNVLFTYLLAYLLTYLLTTASTRYQVGTIAYTCCQVGATVLNRYQVNAISRYQVGITVSTWHQVVTMVTASSWFQGINFMPSWRLKINLTSSCCHYYSINLVPWYQVSLMEQCTWLKIIDWLIFVYHKGKVNKIMNSKSLQFSLTNYLSV